MGIKFTYYSTYLMVFGLLLFQAISADGQSAQLEGAVIGENQEPVPLAVIELLQASDSVFVTGGIADDQGQFKLENLKAGAYLTRVSSLGYLLQYSPAFELEEAEKKSLGIVALAINATELATIEVKGKRPVLEQKIDMTVLNLSTMITDGKNSLDVLRFGPGLMVRDDGNISMNNKSSLIIMVDGKEMKAEGESLGTMLRSISASSIERVEVISNPSARYDAAGSAGIINIVLKRNGRNGTKYFFDQNVQYATNIRSRTGLSINHRKDKFYFHSNLSYSYGDLEFLTTGYRIATVNDQDVKFDQDFTNDQLWRSPSYRVGVDYNIDERQTVRVSANGFFSKSNSDQTNISEISAVGGGVDSVLTTFYTNPHNRYFNIFNANYSFEDTSGQRINIDVDFGDFNFAQERSTLSETRYPSMEGLFLDDRLLELDNLIKTYSFKSDWVRPLNQKMTFETGVKAAFTNVDHDLGSTHKANGETMFRIDSMQANNFFFDERILAGYVNFAIQHEKIGFQVGFRGEQTSIKGLSTDLFNTTIPQPDSTYFNLFPSVFFTYKIAPRHKTRLSYSRRINRPHYSDVNPFSYYENLYSFWRGNALLGPDFTDNYELSYDFQDQFNVSVSYSDTRNLNTYFTIQEDGVDINSVKNAGSVKYLNFNFSTPRTISKWWDIYLWVGVYGHFFDGEIGNLPLEFNQWGTNGYFSNTFKLNQWALEASAWFNTPSRRIMVRPAARGAANISLGRKILNNKGYLKLQLNDVFLTQPSVETINFNGVRSGQLMTMESRSIAISFNYNFGNEKIRDAQQRSTASEDERNRAN